MRAEQWDRNDAAASYRVRLERPEQRGVGDALRSIYSPPGNRLPDDITCLLDKLDKA